MKTVPDIEVELKRLRDLTWPAGYSGPTVPLRVGDEFIVELKETTNG